MVQTARIGSTGIEISPNIRKNKDEVMYQSGKKEMPLKSYREFMRDI